METKADITLTRRQSLAMAGSLVMVSAVPVASLAGPDDMQQAIRSEFGDGEIIAEGWNQPIISNDATSHAEIMAMREAGEKLGNYRLLDTTVYVTLEPCSMCVGAMIHARVGKVVYAASEPRTGALGGAFNLLEANQHNHIFEVKSSLMADESRALLQNFFQSRRK